MAGEACVGGVGVEAREGDARTPRPVFLVPALDTPEQRQQVVRKVLDFVASESTDTPGGVTCVGQVGWEEVGQVCSLTSHLMTTCRSHRLLPSERCILLSLHDQYQAIQLCLARINKVRQGEFMAAASDVLDVWNAMYKETVTAASPTTEHTKALQELNHLTTSQESGSDPMRQELLEVVKEYRDFLDNSLCVDHFRVFECLQRLLKDNPTLFRDVFSEAYIIEGLEHLPVMERELLKLISKGSQVYRVSAELPFLNVTPASPSALNISGIHENTNLQTPSQHSKQQTHETNNATEDTKDSHIPQTPVQQDREKTNLQNDTTSNPQTPGNKRQQTNDAKDADSQGGGIVTIEKAEESLEHIVNGTPRYPPKAVLSSESEAYIERLFLAHLRLLVNTRDELALTLACSMPGREITHQGFTDIRQEAQKKEMPMYQTIMSFILRKRLGGKGYQPDPNNPVLLHARPLGEFVDALMKLQGIFEGHTDARQGAVRVLSGLKTGLCKMKGCLLKRSMIEAVTARLSLALRHLTEEHEGSESASAKQGGSGNKPSSLHPSLKHLIQLCDVAGGQAYSGGVVDALGDDLLTQLSSSKKGPQTPVRVPSVLNLFRSPEEVMSGKREKREDEDEEDLQTRVKRKMGKATTAPAQPKRYKSDCSWAPCDLSPINAEKLNHSSSPISGPSLVAVGGASRHSSEGWKEIVASVTQKEDEPAPSPSQSSSSPVKSSSLAPPKGPKEGDKPKKARSKRSLLKDISNMDKNADKTQGKKQNVSEGKKEVKGRKGKTKPLLQGQRCITSFFKP